MKKIVFGLICGLFALFGFLGGILLTKSDKPEVKEEVALCEHEGVENVKQNAEIMTSVEAESESQDLQEDLPLETIVNIAGIDVTFILVDEMTIRYGYDRRRSRKLNSEPVHSVKLSKFYMSKDYVSTDLVNAVYGKKVLRSKPLYDGRKEIGAGRGKAFLAVVREDEKPKEDVYEEEEDVPYDQTVSIQGFISKLNQASSNKFSVPTEVQWYSVASRKAKNSNRIISSLPTELVMGVSMSAKNDPKGQYYTLRGTSRVDDDLRLYDRNAVCAYGISKDKIEIDDDNCLCAPFHLVFNP